MSVRLNEDLTFTFQALLLGQALNLIATNLAAVNFLGGQLSAKCQETLRFSPIFSETYQYSPRSFQNNSI